MSESDTPERWLPVVGWEGYYEVSDLGGFRVLERVFVNSLGHEHHRRGRRLSGSLQRVERESKNYGPQVSEHWTIKMKLGERLERRFLHVAILEAFVGPRPDGQVGRHLDDNPHDNRLSNLAWGTYSDNMNDLVRNGHHRGVAQSCCVHGHELTGANLFVTNTGARRCKACGKARAARRRARRRGEEFDFVTESHRWYARIQADPEARREKVSEDDVLEIRRRVAGGESQSQIAKHYGVSQTQISNIVLRKSWKHIA